jgi:hypothetical protein
MAQEILTDDVMEKKGKLMNLILQNCVANDVRTTGDLFLGLAFRSNSELKKMCAEMCINTKGL